MNILLLFVIIIMIIIICIKNYKEYKECIIFLVGTACLAMPVIIVLLDNLFPKNMILSIEDLKENIGIIVFLIPFIINLIILIHMKRKRKIQKVIENVKKKLYENEEEK